MTDNKQQVRSIDEHLDTEKDEPDQNGRPIKKDLAYFRAKKKELDAKLTPEAREFFRTRPSKFFDMPVESMMAEAAKYFNKLKETSTSANDDNYYDAATVAEHLAICSQFVQNPRWKEKYLRRYSMDERYASHEYIAVRAWMIVDQNLGINLGKIMAYEQWFTLGMPTWWVTGDVVDMIEDANPQGDRLDANELPDQAGLIMLPKGTMSFYDSEKSQDVEIVAISFATREAEGVMILFHNSLGGMYEWYCEFDDYLDDREWGNWGTTFGSELATRNLARLAVRLLQVIHDAKPTIKESTEQSPRKVKHGEIRAALWSRRMVGEGFRYNRKPHQGGSHRPPRLHRRKAHVRAVWVGARSSEERRTEERNIRATWVSDGSLSADEKAEVIALFGSLFEK